MIGICDYCAYRQSDCKGNKDLEKLKCDYYKKPQVFNAKEAAERIAELEVELDKMRSKCEVDAKWIPVSQRLPEIGQKVLVSTKRTVFTQVFKGIYSEPNIWHWEHNSIKVVTAWFPLPEPYKGGDEK